MSSNGKKHPGVSSSPKGKTGASPGAVGSTNRGQSPTPSGSIFESLRLKLFSPSLTAAKTPPPQPSPPEEQSIDVTRSSDPGNSDLEDSGTSDTEDDTLLTLYSHKSDPEEAPGRTHHRKHEHRESKVKRSKSRSSQVTVELVTTFKSQDFLLKEEIESEFEDALGSSKGAKGHGGHHKKKKDKIKRRKIRLRHKRHLRHVFCCGCHKKPYSEERKESLIRAATMSPLLPSALPPTLPPTKPPTLQGDVLQVEEVQEVQEVQEIQEKPQDDAPKSTKSISIKKKVRRSRITDKPDRSINVFSVLKNAVGKELSKIPFPVNFSEPLSMLQRLTEELEYSWLLDRAAEANDPGEELTFVSAFIISAYAITAIRFGKPFNPLMGETFEFDRTDDLGWRLISEQVSHHPPVAAFHCESLTSGWVCFQEFSMSSKFKGNSLEIHPTGVTHLTFPRTGSHYTWRKISSTVKGILFGRMYIEHYGEMTITNHTNSDTCKLTFTPGPKRSISGVVSSGVDGRVVWRLRGAWDGSIEVSKEGTKGWHQAWKRNLPKPESAKYYNMTEFACQLNELEAGVAPTDSRLRPDQRLMEEGKWDEANDVKILLEKQQRARRRLREIEVIGRPESQTSVAILNEEGYQPPSWFSRRGDPVFQDKGQTMYQFNGQYWSCKEEGNWSRCPVIYLNRAEVKSNPNS